MADKNKAKTSNEYQSTVLIGLIHDSQLLGLVIEDLNLEFFSNIQYQFIYKILYAYYTRYKKSPTNAELLLMAQQNYNKSYGDYTEIVSTINTLYLASPPDSGFTRDLIETFIRRAKFESILSTTMDKFTNDNNYTIDEVYDTMVKSYDYKIVEDDCMRLDDLMEYEKCRTDYLGDDENPKIIKSFVSTINNKLSYKGYKPADLGVVIAAPGTGKTSFLINEAIYASSQNYNVLNVYLGDMVKFTSANRIMANVTGIPISEYSLSKEKYEMALRTDPRISKLGLLNRIYTISFPPGYITVNKLITLIDKLQTKHQLHFDLIIVDYADNFVEESDQMYQNGGQIYNKLKSLATVNKSVVLTASQPPKCYWSSEIIPFDGVAESSKKLHVVDETITLGKPTRGANIATGFLAKIREGETGGIFRLKLDLEIAKMTEISESEYSSLKSKLFEKDEKLSAEVDDN